jgi:hypothetical protein
MSHFLVWVRNIATLAFAVFLAWSSVLWAGETKQPLPPVNAWNGSFTQSIPIVVPKFRGLEPRLTLSYDSARGIRNIASVGGWTGIGWTIDGMSTIERISGSAVPAVGQPKLPSGMGAPAWGAAGLPPDSYMIDGAELIPCAEVQNQASTPSCLAGGMTASLIGYAPRVENYIRIRFNTANNTWEVTGKDGLKQIYSSVEGGTTTTTFRWLLTSVVDRRGNHVDYAYTCSAGVECLISMITYLNQGSVTPVATIKFYAEARPGPGAPTNESINYATGNSIRTISQRIKTIEVRTAVGLVRAYAFGYDATSYSHLSRLFSLQEYGKDAVIDAAGAISAGTSLPAYQFTYSDPTYTGGFQPVAWTNIPPSGVLVTADLNGDGYSDLCTATNTYLSSGSGFNIQAAGSGCVASLIDPVDVTGDGIVDIVTQTGTATVSLVAKSWNGTGYTSTTIGTSSASANVFDGGPALGADLDGDGRYEVITINDHVWKFNGTTYAIASGFVLPNVVARTGAFIAQTDAVDINGDGKQDIYQVTQGVNVWTGQAYLSTGTAFVVLPSITAPQNASIYNAPVAFGDVNGDGYSDLINTTYATLTGNILTRFALSNGYNIPMPTAFISWPAPANDPTTVRFADFSGDGRTDILYKYDAAGTTYSLLKFAGDHFINNTLNAWTVPTPLYTGNFRGRQKVDVISGTTNIYSYGLTGNDELVSVKTPIGGTNTATYMQASGTPNTRLPFPMRALASVSLNDGRGQITQTDFTYTGGAWNNTERQFMGFQTVTATLPANAGETARPKIVSTYGQSLACLGQASTIEQKDSSGVTLKSQIVNFTTDTEAPFICQPTTNYDTITVSAQTKTTHTWKNLDTYGNLLTLIDFGNDDIAGDERTAYVSYFQNTTDFTVGCPAEEWVFEGNGSAGPLIKQSRHFYNGAIDQNTPTTRCEETRTDSLISGATWATVSNSFNAYGNLVSATDATGNRTDLIYDPVYNLYVTETRLPKYFAATPDTRFKATATWDQICQLPLTSTDLNLQTITNIYDESSVSQNRVEM